MECTGKTPKVLFVFPAEKPCGIHDYAAALIPQIAKRGFEPEIAAPARAPKELEGLLRRAADNHLVHVQFDSAHWQGPNHNWFPDFTGRLKKPLVITLHEVYEENPFSFPYAKVRSVFPGLTAAKRWIYRKRHPSFTLERDLRKRHYNASALIVHTEAQKRILLRDGMAEDKIHVIPHGVWSAPAVALRQEPPVWQLGTFGFINPSSDFETVLKTLPLLGISWRYEIGGGARLKEHEPIVQSLKQAITNWGLEGRIHLKGRIQEDDLDAFFAGLDLYVAPFKFKSSSGSLNRAIAHGLPIVASEIDLTMEINKRIPLMATYKPGDPDSLRAAIESVIRTPARRAEMAEASRRYAQLFSFSREAADTAGLYGRCMGQ